MGKRAGKEIIYLGKRGIFRVVPIKLKFSTKLSTGFSTAVSDSYPKIHRLYYCYNVIYNN